MGLRAGVTVAFLLWTASSVIAAAACSVDRVELRGEFGTVSFRTELALTPEAQRQGLMFRDEMARLASMLFVFPDDRERGFWMRNTLIPLDMLFIDRAGRVIRIHENAIPGDETAIRSGAPARAVLEINGGLASELGLAEGDEIRSPAMPQDAAAWPCK